MRYTFGRETIPVDSPRVFMPIMPTERADEMREEHRRRFGE